jgi:hypothetical protein
MCNNFFSRFRNKSISVSKIIGFRNPKRNRNHFRISTENRNENRNFLTFLFWFNTLLRMIRVGRIFLWEFVRLIWALVWWIFWRIGWANSMETLVLFCDLFYNIPLWERRVMRGWWGLRIDGLRNWGILEFLE